MKRTIHGLSAAAMGLGLLITVGVGAQDPYPSYRPFQRGDINVDGGTSLPDVIVLLDYLFTAGSTAPDCLDAADVNDDESTDLVDGIFLLTYLFNLGDPPPAPFGLCGPDSTLNVALSCEAYPPCGDLTDIDQAAHVMRRAGFGPTPEGLDAILAVGTDAYLDQQLYPELIDESGNALLNQINAVITPESDLLSLIWLQVARALYSERQLHEALTEFWENHFTTDLLKVRNLIQQLQINGVPLYTPEEATAETVYWEYQENQLLRENALGNFVDLLTASASGKPMLVYLDGIYNIVGSPNENYGRELVELHTMGVDNGYTQIDIEQIARCFTGWTICRSPLPQLDDPHGPCLAFDDPAGAWTFHFHPPYHDYGSKVIFAGTSYELFIPARPVGSTLGIQDGLEVITHLSGLAQTADFVSTKLIRRLVDDEAPPALVAECIATWLATNGDLRELVSTIVHSDEFLGTTHRWSKVMTPLEFLVAQPRTMGIITSGLPIIYGTGDNPFTGLVGLDYIPFLYETPEGRSEFGFDWMASTNLLNRILYSNGLARSDADPAFDPVATLIQEGVPLSNVEVIADFWLQRAFQNRYTLAERALVIDFLNDVDGEDIPLDPAAPDYADRIRAVVGFVLSAPQAQKQ